MITYFLQEDILSIRDARGKTESYTFHSIPSDWGKAFRLLKHSGGVPPYYDVMIAGKESSCDCMGFCAHGHCKHLEVVKDMLKKKCTSGSLAS